MKDARLRQPFKAAYSLAIGEAISCFTICEWNAIYCADKIRPGSLCFWLQKELTSGQIAKKFKNVAESMSKTTFRQEVIDAASSFLALVPERNRIVHGKPCTGKSGEAALWSSKEIEISDLNLAADKFSACSDVLNGLLYGPLKDYKPPAKAKATSARKT